MIRLGFHLSIGGAISNSAKEAAQSSYNAFQIFTTSSRSWKNSIIREEDSKEFIKCNANYGNLPYAHIPYLCNIASANEEVYQKSKQMLVDNMNNCTMLGIDGLVIHLGSHLGKGVEYGTDRICSALTYALELNKSITILLENGSGYTNSVGSKFEEIGKITDTLSDKRIGVCFDTCHGFAAGYDMRTEEQIDRLVEEFDSQISLSRLGLVHLNDAKFPLGSGLDRHGNISTGNIGRIGFVSLFRNKNFRDGSFVMETPVEDENTHFNDIEEIKSIIKEATGKAVTN